jgi:hypothetical protein
MPLLRPASSARKTPRVPIQYACAPVAGAFPARVTRWRWCLAAAKRRAPRLPEEAWQMVAGFGPPPSATRVDALLVAGVARSFAAFLARSSR